MQHTRFMLTLYLGLTATLSAQPLSMRLEDLEQLALRRNPLLAQARTRIRTAAALRQQAALYPNPEVGYTASEVNAGQVFNYGEHGFFAQQRLVTAGKLQLARQLAEQDIELAKAQAEAVRLRVLGNVQRLYYQALGEQRLIEVRQELSRLAQRAVQTTRELLNVGQADQPDLMAVLVEAQRLELALVQARNALERTWRQLAAETGDPQLAPVPLAGDLEQLPALDFDTELERIYAQSPEMRSAEITIRRSDLAVSQARAAVVPDLVARGGLHYNRERLGLGNQPIGWQGSAEVSIALPLFNRNQGAIAAARAEAERASLAVDHARLDLRSRLASVFRQYRDSLAAVERYRKEMIPTAQKAYELYSTAFRRMAAAYPQVLIAQRNLFQVQEDYLATLMAAWQAVVDIRTLLVPAQMEP